jgi:hypothetical protein
MRSQRATGGEAFAEPLSIESQHGLGQKLAQRLARGRVELSGANCAIVVWISGLKPLFDDRKVLVLAQRARCSLWPSETGSPVILGASITHE